MPQQSLGETWCRAEAVGAQGEPGAARTAPGSIRRLGTGARLGDLHVISLLEVVPVAEAA